MKAVQTLKTLASEGAPIWMGKIKTTPISIIASPATTRFAVRYCPLLSATVQSVADSNFANSEKAANYGVII